MEGGLVTGFWIKGVARVYFLPRHALAEFQHVNYIIVRIWKVKRSRVACYARAENFTEAVASVASMVATPLPIKTYI